MNETIHLGGATVRLNDDGLVLLDFNLNGPIDHDLAVQAAAAVRMLSRGTAPCLVRMQRANGWTQRARSVFGQTEMAGRTAVVGTPQLAQLGQRLFDGSRAFDDESEAIRWLTSSGAVVVRFDGELLASRSRVVQPRFET